MMKIYKNDGGGVKDGGRFVCEIVAIDGTCRCLIPAINRLGWVLRDDSSDDAHTTEFCKEKERKVTHRPNNNPEARKQEKQLIWLGKEGVANFFFSSLDDPGRFNSSNYIYSFIFLNTS
mmetsp:Transcript_2414/g.5284  ORF Transcript_2414/g.5284 Transcript_2414/m.5284 type:complete len:119 (+) Transcript_2414:678-1034(+)